MHVRLDLAFSHGLVDVGDRARRLGQAMRGSVTPIAPPATIFRNWCLLMRFVGPSRNVAMPTQARLGWRNVANPNLVNKEGVPASPFQTNNWQGGTSE